MEMTRRATSMKPRDPTTATQRRRMSQPMRPMRTSVAGRALGLSESGLSTMVISSLDFPGLRDHGGGSSWAVGSGFSCSSR
jgi:hypothetical protein